MNDVLLPEANEAWHIERINDFEDDSPIQAGPDPLAPDAHFQGEGWPRCGRLGGWSCW